MNGNTILAVGSEAQEEFDANQAKLENNNGTSANNSTTPGDDNQANQGVDSQGTESNADAQPDSKGTDGSEVEESNGEDESLYWGDTAVEVEVPQEISDALKEHKIDQEALLKELFTKDGNFDLSDATKAKLEKAFGKQIVSGYLNLYKQQNQMAVDKFSSEQESVKQQIETNSKDFSELVGGDDGWSGLSEWAENNLSDEGVAEFNAAMGLGAEHYRVQRLVVEALMMKKQMSDKSANGDQSVILETDKGSNATNAASGVPATLTRQEFQALLFTDRYKKDKAYAAQVDAVRVRTQKSEKPVRR